MRDSSGEGIGRAEKEGGRRRKKNSSRKFLGLGFRPCLV